METHGRSVAVKGMRDPHSLGIPIEWKLVSLYLKRQVSLHVDPHSLGIPIEWKQLSLENVDGERVHASPLAGDTN